MPINLDFLSDESKKYKTDTFTYSDLHLDFKLRSKLNNAYVSDTGSKNEIQVDYDLEAIKNSIRNIFNTKTGQKILNPAFGLDLGRFLFQPISKETARQIGNEIMEQLSFYEPRVAVKKVDIIGREQQNEYFITLVIAVPELNNLNANISGTLNETGFTY